MRTHFLPGVLALALVTWAGAVPANAQTPPCPYGYYYATDGQCYPGPPPTVAPPVYAVAPPVYQPPVVLDGLAVGIGLGALIGGAERGGGRERGGREHGGGGGHQRR